MILEYLLEQVEVNQHQSERGGECWERPVSCSRFIIAEADYKHYKSWFIFKDFRVQQVMIIIKSEVID